MLARPVRCFIAVCGLLTLPACKSKPAHEGSAADGGSQPAPAGMSAAAGGSGAAQPRGGQGGASAAAGRSAAASGSGGGGGVATLAGRSGAPGSAGASAGRDGGGGSGGSAVVAGSTAPADFFGASRCTGALLLCDGFEAATIDKTVWQTKFTAPTIDGTRAARGKQSLHFSTGATTASGIEVSKLFPTANNDYYGRLFVYFDAVPTSPQWAHWTIVGAKGTGVAGEVRVGGQFDGKINRFGVGSDGGPTGDWTNLDGDPQNGSSQVREDQWLCVEWQHDGSTDQSRFFLDGVEHPSLGTTRDVKHGGNTGVKYDLPDISAVWFGFWNYDQGKTVVPSHFDVWIDEVAFDEERIGCSL